MTTKTSPKVLDAAVQLARTHWEKRAAASNPNARSVKEPKFMSVAISRQAGAEVPELVQKLGEELGWAVYDRELLEKIADERGIRVELLEVVDERYVSWIEELLNGLSSNPNYTGSAYAKHLFEVLQGIASLGECIIVGRGAAQVLPRKSTLRVRFVAPKSYRVAWVMQRKGIADTEAVAWIDKTEKDRARFIHEYVHQNPDDPLHYDLTLDVSRWDKDSLVQITLTAIKLAIANSERG